MAKYKIIKYFTFEGKNIYIAFDKLLSNENYESFREFILSIASKKTFSKIADLISSENNKILSQNTKLAEEFIYKYFIIKLTIDQDNYKNRSHTAVINEMITTLFTQDIINLVDNYINNNFKSNVNEEIDFTKNKYNKGTTFLDRHYKIMYKISCLSRLIIPLATHYIHNNPSIPSNKFLIDLFTDLFQVAQYNTNIDIYMKLYTFVESAVNRTRYSDRIMWERLMILGVTPENVIHETVNKLIINVIIKYSFTQNIMNLNTVVIRKSVMSYTLRKKDPFTLYALTDSEQQSSDDDSISSEIDIFDSYNTQRDESVLLFRRYGIEHDIKIIQYRENIQILPEELEFYSKEKRYHEFQKYIICFIFSKYFGGVSNVIGGCSKEDWVKLIIISTKLLNSLGLTYLSEFISGVRVNYTFKRMSKFLDNYILEHPLYNTILEKKYRSILGLIEKRNIIKNLVICIINNTYMYNSYGNNLNGQYIDKSDETKIVDQILEFFNTFIV
jgi:hypothetical protein